MRPGAEATASTAVSSRRAGRPFAFSRLVGGTWLAYTSYGVLLAVLPIAELAEGGGPLLATLVIGAPLLAQTLASWGWGWLADRTGSRRAPLVLAAVAQAPMFLSFPLLDAPELFAMRVAQAALFGSVVLGSTLATEDPSASAAFRLGRLQLAQSGGMMTGVVVAFPLLVRSGFSLASAGGWELSALLAGLTVAAAGVLALSGELPRPPPAAERARFDLRSHPGVFRLAGATAAVSSFRYVPVTAIPVYLASRLGSNGFFGLPMNVTAQLAIWLAVTSLLNVFASPISGAFADRTGSRRAALVVFSFVYAALWLALVVAPNYPVTFAVWVLPVSVFVTVGSVREAAGQSRPAERGRAVGLLTAAFNSGGLFGGALAGGLLASGWGIDSVFLVATLGSFASAFLFLPQLLRLPTPAEAARTTG